MENNEFVTTQTNAVKWSAPDSTENYINENNYVKVNPKLVKYLKRKIKEEQGIKRTDLLYHYLYFCDAIIDLKIRNKKFKDIEYTHINYKTIIKVISKYKYKKIVNNLLDWGVVECDNIIKIGSKSKGYKLKPPFDTNFKEILIKDKKINEKIKVSHMGKY
jgi:hypothetical protein